MHLTIEQAREIISNNTYKVSSETKFISRCIDGRYENAPHLPALAIPGADMGELGILYAASIQYGFEVDYKRAFKTLQKLVEKENISWHTNCGHMEQLHLDPEAYTLQKADIVILDNQIKQAEQEGAKPVVIEGDHREGAVLLVRGNYGVLPQSMLYTDTRTLQMQMFIFHKTLVDERHKKWAKFLIEEKAVTFTTDLDEEYLYEVLSNTTDDHLFETSRRLAKDLPIFQVTFAEDGSFEVEQQGFV